MTTLQATSVTLNMGACNIPFMQQLKEQGVDINGKLDDRSDYADFTQTLLQLQECSISADRLFVNQLLTSSEVCKVERRIFRNVHALLRKYKLAR